MIHPPCCPVGLRGFPLSGLPRSETDLPNPPSPMICRVHSSWSPTWSSKVSIFTRPPPLAGISWYDIQQAVYCRVCTSIQQAASVIGLLFMIPPRGLLDIPPVCPSLENTFDWLFLALVNPSNLSFPIFSSYFSLWEADYHEIVYLSVIRSWKGGCVPDNSGDDVITRRE